MRCNVALASLHRNEAALRLQLGDRAGFVACHEAVRASGETLSSWLLGAIATMWDGLVALLDGDPAGAERFAEAMVSVRPSERNLVASSAGMLVAVDRWRGTLSERASALADYARSEPGLPLASGLAAVALALDGDGRARAVLDGLLGRAPSWPTTRRSVPSSRRSPKRARSLAPPSRPRSPPVSCRSPGSCW